MAGSKGSSWVVGSSAQADGPPVASRRPVLDLRVYPQTLEVSHDNVQRLSAQAGPPVRRRGLHHSSSGPGRQVPLHRYRPDVVLLTYLDESYTKERYFIGALLDVVFIACVTNGRRRSGQPAGRNLRIPRAGCCGG